MKKLKIIITSIFLSITISIAFTGCNSGTAAISPAKDSHIYELTIKEAEEINKNSKLGLEFFSFSTVDEEDANRYGPDHPETASTDDRGVYGYYFNYPYYSKDSRLTQIVIETPQYNIYGIKVGDDVSTVKSIMEEKGYELTENTYVYEGTNTETYIKYHIYLRFETNNTEIISILVSTYDPNEPVEVY